MNSQQSIHEAFLWVRQVYEEGRVFLGDAKEMADALAYRAWEDKVYTKSAPSTEVGYPFVCLAVLILSHASTFDDEGPGKAAVVAIDFHSASRVGPHLLAGSVAYSDFNNVGVYAVDEGVRLRGESKYFQSVATPDGSAYVQRRVGTQKGFAGIEEFRHVEIPLTTIDTPDKLRRIVEATIAFVEGDEQPLVNIRTEFIAATQSTGTHGVAP